MKVALLYHVHYTVIYTCSKGSKYYWTQTVLRTCHILGTSHLPILSWHRWQPQRVHNGGLEDPWWFPKLNVLRMRDLQTYLHMREGLFMKSGKAMAHLTGTWCWPSKQQADVPFCPALLSYPLKSCLPCCVCLCALAAWHVWFPTARPSVTANHHCFAEIHGPMKLFQLTQDMASGVQAAERKSCLCSISVSWLVHSDLTPDSVSKCSWSTNNSVVGLVISSSLGDAQKSSGLCPFALKQMCVEQGSPITTVLLLLC